MTSEWLLNLCHFQFGILYLPKTNFWLCPWTYWTCFSVLLYIFVISYARINEYCLKWSLFQLIVFSAKSSIRCNSSGESFSAARTVRCTSGCRDCEAQTFVLSELTQYQQSTVRIVCGTESPDATRCFLQSNSRISFIRLDLFALTIINHVTSKACHCYP